MDDQFEIPDEEYETQFFGYSPTDIFEGVKELVQDRYEYGLQKLEEQMKKIPPEILPEQELSEGIAKLRVITNESIQSTLQKMRKHLLGKLMKIPPHILLPEDTGQVTQSRPTFEDNRILRAEIEDLKNQLKAEKHMEAIFSEELKDIEMVLQAQADFLANEFCPANRARIDEEKEKILFLSTNMKGLAEARNSLQENIDPTELELAQQNALEMDLLQ